MHQKSWNSSIFVAATEMGDGDRERRGRRAEAATQWAMELGSCIVVNKTEAYASSRHSRFAMTMSRPTATPKGSEIGACLGVAFVRVHTMLIQLDSCRSPR